MSFLSGLRITNVVVYINPNMPSLANILAILILNLQTCLKVMESKVESKLMQSAIQIIISMGHSSKVSCKA